MSEKSPTKGATSFGGAKPIFRVKSLRGSLDYYVNVLGFEIEWEEPGLIASVSRDRCCIYLCEGDQGNPGSWAWIGVGDAAVLWQDFIGKGAIIRHPPTNYSWAYEMQVADPDGNVLRLGSEPKMDEPFGEWLDMQGCRWRKSADGAWTRVDGG